MYIPSILCMCTNHNYKGRFASLSANVDGYSIIITFPTFVHTQYTNDIVSNYFVLLCSVFSGRRH